VILLYFGYTKCPDVCPTSLALITQAINELSGDELKEVVSLFVSVDPKRDTPQSLAEYVGYFHDNFIGVTGSPAEVAEAARRYGAQYHEVELKDSALGYAVNHSSATYLVDAAGELRFVFPHETPPSVLLEGVRYLLAER
jgi:protein SCO1/2